MQRPFINIVNISLHSMAAGHFEWEARRSRSDINNGSVMTVDKNVVYFKQWRRRSEPATQSDTNALRQFKYSTASLKEW